MTDRWKERYFHHLFSINVRNLADPYTDVLNDLDGYPRRKGDKVLAFSFVSKLVSIHDESRPIFDKHVGAFFGITPPSTGSNAFRIEGFIRNLMLIQDIYSDWSQAQDFVDILVDLKKNHPSLTSCHNERLFDFLVWAVGRHKISEQTHPV